MIFSDHMSLLYGRKNEIAYLQRIEAAVLQKGEFIVDYCSLSNILLAQNDCEATQPTQDTSNSEEDSCANEASGIHHNNDSSINIGGEGGCHFVLVSGSPGAGKRSLVTAALLQNKMRQGKTSFIYVSERFTTTRNNSKKSMSPRRPFQALQAIHEIVRLASQNFEMSTAIEQKLKLLMENPDDTSALCDLIPGARKWLQVGADIMDSTNSDRVPELSKLPPSEIGMRFGLQSTQAWIQILQRFLDAIVSIVPVVILFEDVQYADEISLALIKSLLATNENRTVHQQAGITKGLIIVATLNVLDCALSSNALISYLESSNSNGEKPFTPTEASHESEGKPVDSGPNMYSSHRIHQVIVSDVSWDDVNEWVHACGGFIQRCSAEQKIEITNLVFHHSNGNPLHIRYILLFLEHDESLFRDPIHKKRIPYKIDDLFISILLLQEDVTLRKVVQVISLLAQFCEGYVYRNILDIAMNLQCGDTIEAACWLGLIECSSTRPTLYFYRESFQKAVHSTIADVSSLYLEIGRNIWRNAILSQDDKKESDEDVIAKVLLSTQLLRNCIALLPDIDERIYMSQLCYETGQKSSSLGDFKTSTALFEFAICVLGAELWRRDLYEASLVLHNAAAQSYCSIADYDNMQKTLDDIFDRASTFEDKLAGYVVLLYAYASQNKLLDLFRTASMVLHELGEPINSNPGTITFFTHMLRTKWALRGKDDYFFSHLPFVENADYFILTQLLSLAMYHSYIFKPTAGLVLCFRLIRISLKHGLTSPSLHAFTCYAFFCCMNEDFDEGYRVGQLALKFSARCGAWWPRINVLVYGRVNPWSRPFRLSIEPLNRARLAALSYGDLDMNASASFHYLITSVSAGISLCKLKMATQIFCQDIAASGQMTQLLSILPLWSVITGLLGEEETLDLGGVVNDANSALKYCIKEGNKFMAGNFYVYRTMWFCLIGEYEQALQMAKKAFEQRQICDYTLTFYEGLAALALARKSASCLTHRLFRRGKKLSKCVKRWADRCPENFRNKQWLLEAEIAALNGKTVQALSLFQHSIGKAKQEAFVHEEAIAYERLGLFQLHLENVSEAKLSLASARSTYERWGATVLVDRMNEVLALTFSS